MPIAYLPRHPLRSAWLKVERAGEVLNHLDFEIWSFERLTPTRPVFYDGPVEGNDGRSRFRFGSTTSHQLNDALGVLVGDFATNLRSSLDNIAWALTRFHGRLHNSTFDDEAQRRFYFPLFRSQGGWNNWRGKAFVDPLSIDTIRGFQPYLRSQRPELELLVRLDELATLNKHRVVTAALAYSRIDLPNGGHFVPFESFDEAPRDYLLPALIADELQRYLESGLPVHVVFSYREDAVSTLPLLGGGFRVDDLREIHDFVRSEVLPSFAPFFLGFPAVWQS